MPGINNKALLLQLEVFIADNNIRSAAFTAVANAQATDGTITEQTFLVKSGDSKTFACLNVNKATIIRVSKPLAVTITNMTGSFVTSIDSLFVHTGQITSISFANTVAGAPDSQVRILQV